MGHGVPCQRDPASLAELLELSDERDQWAQRLELAEFSAYLAGYYDGQFDAKLDDDAEFARRRPRPLSLGPAYEDLEQRRYGDGGRASWMLPDDESPNVRPGRRESAA